MSFSENEHIDDLFKGLQDESTEADIMQFNDMEIRLEKMRFYKFGWKHFNIYHTGMICLCFVFSFWTFIAHLNESDAPADLPARPSTPYLVPTVEKSKAAQENTSRVKRKRNQIEIPQEKSTPLLLDSSISKTVVLNPLIPEPQKTDSTIIPKIAKPRKKVYVSRRDTIIQYDTTRVVKKK
ncbi:MAG: hypothetical protein JWO58_11 [Chitinophagaceae bacterium]|nr:hypothetical protein [Chitinophagaceae bacterium]